MQIFAYSLTGSDVCFLEDLHPFALDQLAACGIGMYAVNRIGCGAVFRHSLVECLLQINEGKSELLCNATGDGGADGLALFSLRGLMAMAAVGGWSGLVMHSAGINLFVTVPLSLVFGFLAMAAIAYIMKLSMRLQSSGNLDLGCAIGKVGSVYIPIPPNMTGSGKINLTIQERFVEIGAVTKCSRKLKTGESVRVVATDEVGLVVVEPLMDEKSE